MTLNARRRLAWVLASVVGFAGLAALYAAPLPHSPEFSICLFRRITGISCPGCGMTRAFAAMAQGEWRSAVAFHPLAPIVALEFLALWFAWGRSVFGRLGEASRDSVVLGVRSDRLAKYAIANGAALLALWLGRLATGTLPR